jgi:hypothetical protein
MLSFVLTAPTSGTFTAGETVAIQWTAGSVKAGSKISLCYDKDTIWGNGNEKWIEIDQVTASAGAGTYNWDTSKVLVGNYYIAGYLWDGANGFTLSHLTSSITIKSDAPAFALTSPMSGSFASGQTIPIQWTANNVTAASKVSLCYDTDQTFNGNEHWIEIDQVAAANGQQTYNWNSTGLTPGTYYIAGYMWNGGNSFNTSHALQPFTVTSALSFALTAPTSGSFAAGTPVSIQWTAANVPTGSKISLCYDEDPVWTGNNQHWIEVDQVTAADGSHSYAWDTTDVTPGTYYIAGYMFDGVASFTLSHLTDSIMITAGGGLTVESTASKPAALPALTASQLAPIVAEAKVRLTAALGDQVSSALAGVSVEIADLGGGLLGEVSGKTVRIDRDAAGYGWYVDPTPTDDAEFTALTTSRTLTAPAGSAAADRADLLTTVMHELGHELGFVHDDLGDLMSATLPLGARRTWIVD